MSLPFISEYHKNLLTPQPGERYGQTERFYVDFRLQEYPSIDGTPVFTLVDATDNQPGSHYLSDGYSQHLVDLPSQFSFEIKARAQFAYDTASNQLIFEFGSSNTARLMLYYNRAADQIWLYWVDGGTPRPLRSQQFDDGTSYNNIAGWIIISGAIDLTTGTNAGSSLWINRVKIDTAWDGAIDSFATNKHKLTIRANDELTEGLWDIAYFRIFPNYLASDTELETSFKTTKAEEIYFDCNGVMLGKTRCNMNGFVNRYNYSGSCNNAAGSYTANRAGATLYNINGEFSDDQYASFDPESDIFNGTSSQKYLQNDCRFEIESWSDVDEQDPDLFDLIDAYYPLDGNSIDKSTNGNDGTDTNVAYSAGAIGQCAVFAGDGDIDCGDLLTIASSQTWWVSLRVKADYNDNPLYCNMISYFVDVDNRMSIYNNYGTSALKIVIRDTASNMIGKTYATATVYDDNWNHLVVHCDGTNILVYFNKTLISTDALSGAYSLSGGAFYIGAGTGNITGSIDDVYISKGNIDQTFVNYLYDHPGVTPAQFETVFTGFIKGGFKRSSQFAATPEITISAEDFVSKLAYRQKAKSVSYEGYDLIDTADETNSLLHSVVRLGSKKEVWNYAGNSDFSDATITDSWSVSAGTLTRETTYTFIGSYCAKWITTAAANSVFSQWIDFRTSEYRLEIGQTWTFYIIVRAAADMDIQLRAREYTSPSGVNNNGTSINYSITAAEGFKVVEVTHTITDEDSDTLLIAVDHVTASIQSLYLLNAMTVLNNESYHFFVTNSNSGASAVIDADDAVQGDYDYVGFDVESFAVTDPWQLVSQGDNIWTHAKKMGDATAASYMGMDRSGTFRHRSAISETDPDILETISAARSITTTQDEDRANKIIGHGSRKIIATKGQILYNAAASGSFPTKDEKNLDASISAGNSFPPVATYGEYWAKYGTDK